MRNVFEELHENRTTSLRVIGYIPRNKCFHSNLINQSHDIFSKGKKTGLKFENFYISAGIWQKLQRNFRFFFPFSKSCQVKRLNPMHVFFLFLFISFAMFFVVVSKKVFLRILNIFLRYHTGYMRKRLESTWELSTLPGQFPRGNKLLYFQRN